MKKYLVVWAQIVAFVGTVFVSFGFLLPYLISANDTLLVVIGLIYLAGLVPILVVIGYRITKNLNEITSK